MFCEHCGAKLEPGDAFCVNCGAKVEYNRDVPTTVAEEPVPKETSTPPKTSIDDTQELPPLEDPTAQPEPVMVFVKDESAEKDAKEAARKQGPSTGLKVALVAVAVLVALLAGALVFLLVSGTSLSDLTGKKNSGEYSYSYASDKTASSEVEPSEAVEPETTRVKETSAKGEYYRVSVGSGNRLSLRAKPDEDSAKLDRIDNGTRLYITEIRGNWGKTTYDGETGWVCMTQNGDRYVVED